MVDRTFPMFNLILIKPNKMKYNFLEKIQSQPSLSLYAHDQQCMETNGEEEGIYRVRMRIRFVLVLIQNPKQKMGDVNYFFLQLGTQFSKNTSISKYASFLD